MTPAEEFDDAIGAVYGLHCAQKGTLSADEWRAQIAQLRRALAAAERLEALTRGDVAGTGGEE